MKSIARLFPAIAACLISPTLIVKADPPPPIVATTFETDPGDWRVINLTGQPADSASISITHAAADVKEGKGSLKFTYSVKKGDTNLLMLPFQPPALANMQSIHFWVKLDHAASLMLMVGEKDGGRYQETFACPANAWQEVLVAPGDLTLNEDEGAAKNPDSKLDPSRVETVGLIDADCYLAQIFGDMPFLNIASGSHTVLLNSFTINDTPLQPGPFPPPPAGVLPLTPLLRPQVDWLVIGGMTVQTANEKPLAGASIKTSYVQTKAKVFALLKGIKIGSFSGVTQLSFNAAATKPTKLMVQVEQTDGNKFNSLIDVPGESMVKSFTLNMTEFTIDKDAKDLNGKLNTALIKQLLIIDIGGAIAEIQDTDNTLWINNVRAIKKP